MQLKTMSDLLTLLEARAAIEHVELNEANI